MIENSNGLVPGTKKDGRKFVGHAVGIAGKMQGLGKIGQVIRNPITRKLIEVFGPGVLDQKGLSKEILRDAGKKYNEFLSKMTLGELVQIRKNHYSHIKISGKENFIAGESAINTSNHETGSTEGHLLVGLVYELSGEKEVKAAARKEFEAEFVYPIDVDAKAGAKASKKEIYHATQNLFSKGGHAVIFPSGSIARISNEGDISQISDEQLIVEEGRRSPTFIEGALKLKVPINIFHINLNAPKALYRDLAKADTPSGDRLEDAINYGRGLLGLAVQDYPDGTVMIRPAIRPNQLTRMKNVVALSKYAELSIASFNDIDGATEREQAEKEVLYEMANRIREYTLTGDWSVLGISEA